MGEVVSEHPRLLKAHPTKTLLVVAYPRHRESATGPVGQLREGNILRSSCMAQAQTDLCGEVGCLGHVATGLISKNDAAAETTTASADLVHVTLCHQKTRNFLR